MFGLGTMEMMVIGAIVVVLFIAPTQLPKLGRSVGQTIKEVKGIGKELRGAGEDIRTEVREVEREVKGR